MISHHIYLSVTLAHKESQMEAARQAARHSLAEATKESTMSRNRSDTRSRNAQATCPRPVRQPWPAPPPGGADLVPRRAAGEVGLLVRPRTAPVPVVPEPPRP